jgi:hypothetical protein
MPKGKIGQGSSGSSNAPTVLGPCFNCNKIGHLARNCPYPKKQQGNPNACHGRLHYTTIEEVPEGEPVMVGMFLVNQYHAVVLFDSRSSHSFVSQAFARKHIQEIFDLDYGYHISLVGADISTRQMVRAMTIKIGNREFLMNLIVLPGLGLDVIMGMSWMQCWGCCY